MENIEVWQVYIFDGHSMHFSLAKNKYSEYDYPSKIKMVDKELKVVLIHEFSDYLNDL